ncbi:MAG: YebC/PmpR family DNA-binding transcriptional regulator [Candidatus Nanosyncoccaceae bacterium]|jgi:YebC/PmpR family DNA-binding regulatory protein
MAGHSKWATTKRQKAVVDAKRGATFSKIGNLIAIAARGGTDPNDNPALALAIEKAKAVNMPKANIDRAIARVMEKGSDQLEEITYEAYGPGGAGIIIEVATDNKNRTFPELRGVINKHGGRLADVGSVMFQFQQKGVIAATPNNEEMILVALDAGAEDVHEEDDKLIIYTDSKELMAVRSRVAEAGMKVISAELNYVPNIEVDLSDEDADKLMNLLNIIDDMDDVVNVYTNMK